MNLLLFDASQRSGDNRITVHGSRARHLRDLLAVSPGSTLKAGEIDGALGTARVLTVTASTVELEVVLDQPAPAPLPLTLVLALPRPKMLRRIFQAVATLGIKQLHLVNSYRVEKSYWQTPWLTDQAIREQLLLGLEQGVDTRLPTVFLHKRFKPFVEDTLPGIAAGTRPLVAHPYADSPCPMGCRDPLTLAIGPEGGFIPYEVDKLVACGFEAVSLGSRILKVETAIAVLAGRLFS